MDVGSFLLQQCTLFHSHQPCSGLISYSVTNSRTSFCLVTSLEDFSLLRSEMSVLCSNNAVYTWSCLQRIRLLRTLGCKEQFVFSLTSMLKCSVKTSTADFCELDYSLLAGPAVFTFLFNGHLLLTATIFERKVA